MLFWSQMHGDEPTATGSLLDLFQFLCRHRDEPWVGAILRKYTLLCIPMLNPDGADLNQRRNAQEIDINRDARALQTPRGASSSPFATAIRPFLGFNLHNQNSLTTVGDTGQVATIALLAVGAEPPRCTGEADDAPADEAGRGRVFTRRSRRLPTGTSPATTSLQPARVRRQPVAVGHAGRSDRERRVFGSEQGPGFPVMLNFVGILAALNSLRTGRVTNANPAVFDCAQDEQRHTDLRPAA